MLTYLLDTSAWLTHVFKEPGWDYINTLFDEDGSSIGISVVSLAELHSRLKALGCDDQFESLCEFYRPLFDRIVPVDESVALRAIALKVLIHRDTHFQCVPADRLKQEMLPANG